MMRCVLFSLLLFVFSAHAADVTLVWQADRKKCWEGDWIEEILEGIDFEVVQDGKFQKLFKRSIVVLSANTMKNNYMQYFEMLKRQGYKFGVILLSDEAYHAPTNFYEDAEFVLRNYWDKKFVKKKKVLTFPLGYKKGFWKDGKQEIPPCFQREYTWSFAGQVRGKPTRRNMLDHLEEVSGYYFHETHCWADSKQLGVIEYRDLLLNSIFAPCPKGWSNLDSFRIYEALECGCIPIVEAFPNDYFTNFFGEHPFLSVKSWEEAPKLMHHLLENPDLLEAKREECMVWWSDYKASLNSQVVKIVNDRLIP